MCYQKFHICQYCSQPYNCFFDNYTCPTINHDVNMDMCESCNDKFEEKLKSIDLEDIDLMNIDIKSILEDE